MRRAFFRSRASRADLEAALDRGVEGLLAGGGPVAEAAASPEHAFAVRPLLDTAAILRAAFDEAPAMAGGRAELVARLHWTPQQRPSVPMRVETTAGALWRTCAAVAPTTATRGLALGGASLFALGLVASLTLTSGEDRASAARLTILAGSVEQQTGDGWQPLSDGAAVTADAHLRLGAGAAALLTFADGSVVTLAEHEEIEVPRGTSERPRNLRIDERRDELVHEIAAGAAGAPRADRAG